MKKLLLALAALFALVGCGDDVLTESEDTRKETTLTAYSQYLESKPDSIEYYVDVPYKNYRSVGFILLDKKGGSAWWKPDYTLSNAFVRFRHTESLCLRHAIDDTINVIDYVTIVYGGVTGMPGAYDKGLFHCRAEGSNYLFRPEEKIYYYTSVCYPQIWKGGSSEIIEAFTSDGWEYNSETEVFSTLDTRERFYDFGDYQIAVNFVTYPPVHDYWNEH